jgi:hypothetical protein
MFKFLANSQQLLALRFEFRGHCLPTLRVSLSDSNLRTRFGSRRHSFYSVVACQVDLDLCPCQSLTYAWELQFFLSTFAPHWVDVEMPDGSVSGRKHATCDLEGRQVVCLSIERMHPERRGGRWRQLYPRGTSLRCQA